MTRVVSIIPARGGSKGIPRKNIRLFCGKPLLAHTIGAALDAKCLNEVYVSTEDHEISEIARHYGAKVIDRPMEFATDTASTFSVIRHATEILDFPEVIVILQPTSPLRTAKHIDEAYAMLDTETDTVIGVCEVHLYLWQKKGDFAIPLFEQRLQRQKMEKQYQENGSLYVTRGEVIKQNDSILGMGISSTGKKRLYVMEDYTSVEIDTEIDFFIVEKLKNQMWRHLCRVLK